MKSSTISKIIELEWEMFTNVTSVGDRAFCQEDPVTFRIVRNSQAKTWTEELLQSYLNDLASAKLKGRNIMTEKYARMMETTYPNDYITIAYKLPQIDEETIYLIEDIIAINLEWEEAVKSRYPGLSSRGRPIHTKDDTIYVTSFETYLRGELKTYSPRTIRIYHNHTTNQRKEGINAAEINLLNQVKAYGYNSLAEAENRIKEIS